MSSGPDQGYAWMIVFACFVINFLFGGLSRAHGVMYVAIINLYGATREAATAPFSIRFCVRNMTGPLIGLLGQKYGIRGLTTIGAVVAALGSIFCSFAPSVVWITIFWGVIHGLGAGLSTNLHMVAINQYFDKYRASALGFGYTGDCFGTFAFPVIIEYLFSSYDERGAFLIIGGILLHVVPIGLLLRTPSWITDAKKFKRSNEKAPRKKYKNLEVGRNSLQLDNTKSFHLSSNSLTLRTLNEFQEGKQTHDSKYFGICKGTPFLDIKGHYNSAFESFERNSNSSRKNKEMDNVRQFTSCKLSNRLPEVKITAESRHNSCIAKQMHPQFNKKNFNSEDGKNILKPSDINASIEGSAIRVLADLNPKSQPFSNRNGSPIQSDLRGMPKQDEKDLILKVEEPKGMERDDEQSKLEEYLSEKTVVKCECPNTNIAGTLKARTSSISCRVESKSMKHADELSKMEQYMKEEMEFKNECSNTNKNTTSVLKTRTSSTSGQVGLELDSRIKTSRFASQQAQNTYGTTRVEDSGFREELKCDIESMPESKTYGMEDCSHQDMILSIEEKMIDDYFKEIPEEETDIDLKSNSPSIIKILIQTNTKPMFILISISMAVYSFLFVTTLTTIIDYATDVGVSEDQGKYLIIGFSVADFFGRLSFGQVIDRKIMKIKDYSCAAMIFMGFFAAAIPLNSSFCYMISCVCMYGLMQGSTAIVFPYLISYYMDANSQAVAMGCLNFYAGLLMLLIAPMIGFFRDNTGSYDCVFYIIGGVAAVVGAVWQFEPMITKFQNKKLKDRSAKEEIGLW